ncbi:MAG: hypothetical protein IK051_00515 [Rhodocyclaceae bacterium]|nr:hypothetical protein [Rhodocyclaceae bacterium]
MRRALNDPRPAPHAAPNLTRHHSKTNNHDTQRSRSASLLAGAGTICRHVLIVVGRAMKHAWFVTGTDTEVGKTFASCALRLP